MNAKNVMTVEEIKSYFNDKVWTETEYNHRSIDYLDKFTVRLPIHNDVKKMSDMIKKFSELCKRKNIIIVIDSYSDYCNAKKRWRKNESL